MHCSLEINTKYWPILDNLLRFRYFKIVTNCITCIFVRKPESLVIAIICKQVLIGHIFFKSLCNNTNSNMKILPIIYVLLWHVELKHSSRIYHTVSLTNIPKLVYHVVLEATLRTAWLKRQVQIEWKVNIFITRL